MKSPQKQAEDLRIVRYYSELLEKYGRSAQSLDWGSRRTQELRFKVLCEIGPLDGYSLLDVGCGLGDFWGYLTEKGVEVSYTGYDITPAMVSEAKRRFPAVPFEVRDLLDESDGVPRFDYVVASGIFALRQDRPMRYLLGMVRRMFNMCRKGVAFNSLSIQAPNRDPAEFNADPSKVLSSCLKITPQAVLRHDYLAHDFTVYLYKDLRFP
jgi:SAM-dependent methyltransferase